MSFMGSPKKKIKKKKIYCGFVKSVCGGASRVKISTLIIILQRGAINSTIINKQTNKKKIKN